MKKNLLFNVHVVQTLSSFLIDNIKFAKMLSQMCVSPLLSVHFLLSNTGCQAVGLLVAPGNIQTEYLIAEVT